MENNTKAKPREIFKKRYGFDCCVCGKKLYAEPSIMMLGFGVNSGTGWCMKCKASLHLKIYPDIAGEYMISQRVEAFLQANGTLEQEKKAHEFHK